MKKPSTTFLVVVALIAGASIGAPAGATFFSGNLPDTAQVSSDRLLAALRSKSLETGGLINRLKGVRELKPEVVYVAQDSAPAPESCIYEIGGKTAGMAYVSEFTMNPPDVDGSLPTYSRNLKDGFDLYKCQEFSVGRNGFLCNEPALGVLDAFADVGASVGRGTGVVLRPGLSWRRWANSRWSVSAAYNLDGSYDLWATFRVNLLGR